MEKRARIVRRTAVLALVVGAVWFLWVDTTSLPRNRLGEASGTRAERQHPVLIAADISADPSAPEEPAASAAAPGKSQGEKPTNTQEIRGVVLDERKRPRRARVTLVKRDAREKPLVTHCGGQGRFQFTGLTAGRYVVRAGVGGRRPTHRAAEAEVAPGDTVTLVLEPHPYVHLYFVDATTGKGLGIEHMGIWLEVDGRTILRRGARQARLPARQSAPWAYRFTNPDPTRRLRLRAQVLGYESSPWIDAPTGAEMDPVYVKLRPDPGEVSRLVINARADTGDEIGLIDVKVSREGEDPMSSLPWVRRTISDTEPDMENGKVTLLLLPGSQRIHFGDYVSLPTRPGEWWVPFTLDVTLAAGQTVKLEPELVRGGFVKLRELDAITGIQFTCGEEKLARQTVYGGTDEAGDFQAKGPLRAGRWTYTYVDSDQRDRHGSVDIVAGRVVDSRPDAAPDEADDENSDEDEDR